MWYKNIQVYQLNAVKKYTENEIEEFLSNKRFSPCSEYQLTSSGWVPIFNEDPEDKLTRKVDEAFFFRFREEKKIIPNDVVKERLKEREKQHFIEHEKKPSKDEKNDYKDAIVLDMAKSAFVSSSYINGYVDFKNKLLVIDQGSTKKAEIFIGFLRESFGSFEVNLLEPEDDPSLKMSGWVANNSVPDNFELGLSCDLKDDDGGSISVKKHDIDTEDVQQHLEHGKKVKKLELIWFKRIQFSLTENFEIKSIKPLDTIQESINDELGESKDDYSKFQANMYMMINDFAEIINDLIENV